MSEDLLRDPLPDPWTFGVTNDGRVFFINDEEKRTTWLHPDTGKPVRSGFRHRQDLPQGWEEGFTETGSSYYINHNRGITTFTLPHNTDGKSKSLKKSKPPKQAQYQNIDNEALRQEKKSKRRSSSFLERSGINIFGRSRSKSRERPEEPKVTKSKSRERPEEPKLTKRSSSKRMKEKREKPEKKPKATRPLSATSIRSSQSVSSVRSKMTASWRDPNKDIIKSGWLYKQDSTGKMRMWRKKWFVLSDFCLYYYKDSKGEEILGSIILPSYTVSTVTAAEDKISRKYAFKVEHVGMKTYYLSADSYNDMALWITALQLCCQPLLPNMDKPKETPEEKKPESEIIEDESSKGPDGSKSKKKDLKNKPEEADDSEFGFNHVVVRPAQPTSSQSTDKKHQTEKMPASNLSSNNNNKHEPPSHTKNGRLPSDSHRSPKSSKHQDKLQGQDPLSPSTAQELYQRSIPREQLKASKEQDPTSKDTQQQKVAHRQEPNASHTRQQPQHQKTRRENGESAYFSDTSGATDSSGRPSNARRGQQVPNSQQNKVTRQDSRAKLGNWVSNQKMRQSGSTLNSPQRTQPPSNFDTASEFSSVSQQYTRKSATNSARGPQKMMGPPSSRRYRARTYNEYMDPMEVASSTISMPPIQHMNRKHMAQTLPRPQSTEDIDKMGRHTRKIDPGQRMLSSKSAGNIVAVDQYGNPVSPRQAPLERNIDNSKRAKSDYVFQAENDLQQQYLASFRKAQSKENQGFRAPKQQHRSQQRPQSAGRSSNSSSGGGLTPRKGKQSLVKSTGIPNDVFSPRSDMSSARSGRSAGQQEVFRFDSPNNMSPRGKASTLPPTSRTSDSGYEVKQVQRGQLRAFVLSRSPQTQLPPPERHIPLKATENVPKLTRNIATERDIEAKLKKLNESERMFQQISNDVSNLLADREKLDADLSIVRSKPPSRYSTGSREVDTQQHKLEQELGNVRAQLANASQKLKEMNRQNENFENEIRRLKADVFEELKNQRSLSDDVYNSGLRQDKEAKRKLEWELGRIEFIINSLHKRRESIKSKLADINKSRDEESPPLSPSSLLSANGRSPRDVKRTSMERRTTQNRPSYSSTSSSGTPNSTPVKKYFTMPGRGVPHATSVDSVTAESLFKTSSRPTSARSVSSIGSATGSLHRTKSASERLFNSLHNNQGSDHEAKEMKRLQKEILRNRRNNLKSASSGEMNQRYSNPYGMTLPTRSHMKVGTDVQMALKQHRMPKVLKRAKRDRAEHINPTGFDIDDLERQVNQTTGNLYSKDSYRYHQEEDVKMNSPRQEIDVEEEEIAVDMNLDHQLIAPDKVEIPERYMDYDNVELSPAEEKMKHKKVAAIERMLAKSGQPGSLPAVHLAAALAVEAGSVARAVAIHASVPPRHPGDGQKENHGGERPVTDGSSSAGEEEEVDSDPSPLPIIMDPDYTEACIV